MRFALLAATLSLLLFAAPNSYSANVISSFTAPDQPTATGSISTAPHVADNATLLTKATTAYPNGVWRLDYATGVGASPLFYASADTCPYTVTGDGDGGGCVKSADNKWWVARFENGVDWREFGAINTATDNHTVGQNTVNAGYSLGLPVWFCGAGTFKITSTIYYYGFATPLGQGTHYNWCNGTIIQNNSSLAAFSPSSAIGTPYPTFGNALYNITFVHPQIDLNLQPGAGIVLAATVGVRIIEPNIFNIGPTGTWSYTDDDDGTPTSGLVPTAGILALGGPVNNVEEVRILDGFVSNGNSFVSGTPYNYTNCQHMGGSGIVFTVPPQDDGGGNPPNGNLVENVSLTCNNIPLRVDYGTDNRFILNDFSYAGTAGAAIGTFGGETLNVTGSITSGGGDTIALTVCAGTMTGGCVTETATSAGGDTLGTLASQLVTKINADTAFATFGLRAAQPSGTSRIDLTYNETGSTAQSNIALTYSGNSSTGTVLANLHESGRNYLAQNQAEGDRYYGIFVGPNMQLTHIDQPASMSGAAQPITVPHGGANGAQTVTLTNAGSAQSNGTPETNTDFNTNSANDAQPYLVNTCTSAVTATLGANSGTTGGNEAWGSVVEFVDVGGCFGTHNLTIAAPGSNWGTITIKGSSTLVLGTNYVGIKLLNDQGTWVPIN